MYACMNTLYMYLFIKIFFSPALKIPAQLNRKPIKSQMPIENWQEPLSS